jgi:hypothetical protein
VAYASSHEVLRSSCNRKAARRAARAEDRSMRQPRAPVSPLEVPTLHATIPAKISPRSCRLSGWLQVIGKGLYSVADCILAPIEHLRTNNTVCKTILWVMPMPTSTLPWPTSRSKQKEISSNVVHSIAADPLDAIRVLSSMAQLC